MGTGQMLVTIGAIMLLGTVILSTNRQLSNSGQIMSTSNYGLEGVAFATRLIQEAEAKPFDEFTANGGVVTGTGNFSTKLGQESGPSDYDDFDDYNGFDSVYVGKPGTATGDYRVVATVRYVMLNPGTKRIQFVSSPQWSKQIDVWVWNTVTTDTVHMHAMMSYWN